MRTALSRFAVVGALVTLVDVGLCLFLWDGGSRGVLAADGPALAAAALVSYALHRSVTFRNDPYRRWLDRAGPFVFAAACGALVDLAVVALLADGAGIVVAKLAAVALAGSARWVLHRQVLLTIVRSDAQPVVERVASPGSLRLSVVVPAFEEGERIAGTVEALRAALATVAEHGGVEIIVVDDGSTDQTPELAEAAGADRVVVHPVNRGKGAAVRTGVLVAQGRTIAFTDADLAYSPDQILGLLDQIEAGWDIVVGSRRHVGATALVRAGRLREIGGRGINWLTHLVLLGHYRDTQCGLKAFRHEVGRAIFERARIDGFAFDVEVFVVAERHRFSVTEVPVRVVNRTQSSVRVVRDAARLIRDLFRVRRWARLGVYREGDAGWSGGTEAGSFAAPPPGGDGGPATPGP